MVLPTGTGADANVRWKLVPIPNTTSLAARKSPTILVQVLPPVPNARGWFSGNALFPSVVVIVGALSSSANSTSSGVASEYSTP